MSTAKERAEIYSTDRWHELRLVAMERDGYLCVECAKKGLTVGAQIVHHIRPIRSGGDPWELDNLESLCRDCHKEKHRKRLPPHHAGPWAAALQELIRETEVESNEAAA